MPNKYSHSGVLAQYCQSGFISLPQDLYTAYLSTSDLASRTIQSQQSTTSATSPSETDGFDDDDDDDDDTEHQTEPSSVTDVSSSSPGTQGHEDEPIRGRQPAQHSHFPFSHKPNPQDRAALIHSFINDIDNEPQPEPEPTRQPHLTNDVDANQRPDPRPRYARVSQERSPVRPSSSAKQSHRADRDAWKSSYPPVAHAGTSSSSLALSNSSSDFALDIPSQVPSHADAPAIAPLQIRTRLPNDQPLDVSGARQDFKENVHLAGRRSLDGPHARRPTTENAAAARSRSLNRPGSRATSDKPDIPPRSANRPPSRGTADDDKTVRDVVPRFKIHPASTYALPNQTVTGNPRTTSRNRRHNRSEDNSLPSVSDSVSETGVEVVENVTLSSDYDNGVKIPEYEASAIDRLPPPQPALPAGAIIPRQASPPPAIGSNETRRIQPRRKEISRPASAMSSETQIYAPLSSTFPTDSSYTDEPSLIPAPNIVRPGSLPESAIERAPEPVKAIGSQSTVHANEQRENHTNLSYDSSGSKDIGIPSILPGVPPHEGPARSRSSRKRDVGRYTPVYRDRKAEWLADPANSVAHYREAFKLGHRHFGSVAVSSPGIADESSTARRLNSLPNSIVVPKFPEAHRLDDFDIRRLSVASDSLSEEAASVRSEATSASASSGAFYPPDIARYRDEIQDRGGRSGRSSNPKEAVRGSSGQTKTKPNPKLIPGASRREDASSGGSSARKTLKQDTDKGSAAGLLRRLRGVSLTGVK